MIKKGKGGETGSDGPEAPQCKSLYAARVENDWSENVRKLAQAHGGSTKTVHAALMRI
jgi:hypothetical protein